MLREWAVAPCSRNGRRHHAAAVGTDSASLARRSRGGRGGRRGRCRGRAGAGAGAGCGHRRCRGGRNVPGAVIAGHHRCWLRRRWRRRSWRLCLWALRPGGRRRLLVRSAEARQWSPCRRRAPFARSVPNHPHHDSSQQRGENPAVPKPSRHLVRTPDLNINPASYDNGQRSPVARCNHAAGGHGAPQRRGVSQAACPAAESQPRTPQAFDERAPPMRCAVAARGPTKRLTPPQALSEPPPQSTPPPPRTPHAAAAPPLASAAPASSPWQSPPRQSAARR
jgi:hypothetical protein